MADVINTGGGDSSVGLILGIIIALALAVMLYFFFAERGDTGGVDAPDVNITAPSVPNPAD